MFISVEVLQLYLDQMSIYYVQFLLARLNGLPQLQPDCRSIIIHCLVLVSDVDMLLLKLHALRASTN